MSGADEPENITKLHTVPRPKAEDSVREDVVQLLENLLNLAREGDVEALFIVAGHADGSYSEACSKQLHFCQMIGQVEVVKQNWIARYLASTMKRAP